MSALPKCTHILVKDLLFQAKYHLSHTQMDLMAYLVNVPYWADLVDGHYVIATSKILSDLPYLRDKTVEASLKVLKDFGLIECKTIRVEHWKGKPYIRGLKITEKGKECNSKLLLPRQDSKSEREEKLEIKNRELTRELEKMKKALEKSNIANEENSKKAQKDNEQPQKTEAISPVELPKEEKIDVFIQKVIKKFGANSKPICNFVPNFLPEVTFYINSYNKLTFVNKKDNFKQISNPQKVYAFWEWLYANPKRVGDVINFSKIPTLMELKQRYVNRIITVKGKETEIIDFVEVKEGVKFKIKQADGTEIFVCDRETNQEIVLGWKYSQKILLGLIEG